MGIWPLQSPIQPCDFRHNGLLFLGRRHPSKRAKEAEGSAKSFREPLRERCRFHQSNAPNDKQHRVDLYSLREMGKGACVYAPNGHNYPINRVRQSQGVLTLMDFAGLLVRMRKLRNHLLPRTFNPVGVYAPRWYDRAAGYRVLAHAEIQWFIQLMVAGALKRCVESAKANAFGLSTDWLITCYNQTEHFKNLEKTIFKSAQQYSIVIVGTDNFANHIERIAEEFTTKVIRQNNGIREANILRLLIPIGVPLEVIESAVQGSWLQKIDEFGQECGKTAHRSGVDNHVDPKTEYETVRVILKGIKLIYAEIMAMEFYSLYPIERR